MVANFTIVHQRGVWSGAHWHDTHAGCFFKSLATATEWCADAFNPQNVANAAWAYATAAQLDAMLLAALAGVVERCFGD